MPPTRFIRLGGRSMSAAQIESEAKQEARKQAQQVVDNAALAVKAELEALLEDLVAQSGKHDANYKAAYARIGKTTLRPAMEGLKVQMTREGEKYIIRVVGGKKQPNNFDSLDRGAPARIVPPRRTMIFPRYEGNIVSKDSGGNKSIVVNRSNIRYTGELVYLHGRKPGRRKGFRIKEREPRNLYNRVIITLRNQSKLFRVLKGAAREWVLKYIPRARGKGAELFDAEKLIIRAVVR